MNPQFIIYNDILFLQKVNIKVVMFKNVYYKNIFIDVLMQIVNTIVKLG